MATNMFKKYTESLTREWSVPSGTLAGDVVIQSPSGQVGVALTDRGDATRPANAPGITGGTTRTGGVGNRPTGATVAVDGTWLLAVTGAVNGDTNGTTAGTRAGTGVWAVEPGHNARVTELTLSQPAADGVLIGVIDDGVIVNNVAPVKIGVVL